MYKMIKCIKMLKNNVYNKIIDVKNVYFPIQIIRINKYLKKNNLF